MSSLEILHFWGRIFIADNKNWIGFYVFSYRSIHISYPDAIDVLEARRQGVDPGGDIKIHGLKNDEHQEPRYIQSFDWTNGCIAITNEEMDEFIKLVPMGTPITIEW